MFYKPVFNFASRSKLLGRPVYVVAGKRTPIGSFGGKLSKIPSIELGGHAIKACLSSINLPGTEIDEAILGVAMQAGAGPGPARLAALKGGVAPTTACTAINKLCSSSLKATNLGAAMIAYDHLDVVLSGGFESMSLIPYTIPTLRRGAGYGHTVAIDLLPNDLTDPNVGKLMGAVAEKTAKDFKITREMCDKWAVLSYERTTKANKDGLLKHSIAPIKISEKETVFEDEEYSKFKREKVSTLKAAFEKDGCLTAVSSSKINDAGIALVLMSEAGLKKYNVKPLARIIGIADGALPPIDFTIAISEAIKPLLRDSGLKANQVDYYELNEAFAVTALSNAIILGIDPHEKLNIWGSAIAYGHPIGMSGARVILQVIDVLRDRKSVV